MINPPDAPTLLLAFAFVFACGVLVGAGGTVAIVVIGDWLKERQRKRKEP